MPVTKGQGQSDITNIKEADFHIFLSEWWLTLAKNALRRWQKYNNRLVYIDTNAGSGFNENCNCPGSPIIFCRAAKNADINYHAFLIEIDQDYALQLEDRVDQFNARVIQGDNRQITLDILSQLPPNTLGLIYIDPNGIPDWDLITKICKHQNAKTMDVLIRYNTNAVWRNLHNGKLALPDALEQVRSYKKNWFGKQVEPSDKWYWSFLLGINYPFKDWQKRGWLSFQTEAGKALEKKLAYSRKQYQKKSQMNLMEVTENTYNTRNSEQSGRKSSGEPAASANAAISGKSRKSIT